MKKSLYIVALIASATATTALAEPVQSYTRSSVPTRSEELRSLRPMIPAGDARPGLLITPAPFENARVDSPDRIENGRLWQSRGPIGSRTQTRETIFGSPGPASFGAGVDTIGEVIFVQPTERRSVIAISPWQSIDENTYRQIQRLDPNLPRTSSSPQASRLLGELRQAQNQWLEEEGYILNVRTHVNIMAHENEADIRPASERIEPRGVIRVTPAPVPSRMVEAPTEE